MRRALLAATFATVVAAGAAGAPPAAMPHPAPNPPARLTQEAACERCHAAIAEEWRASLHHTSFTDRTFQRAFDEEQRDPFCKGCHAPEGDTAPGVGCVTCHLTGGAVLATAATPAAPAPHPVTRAPAFATPAACARCHEFAFPDSALRQTPLAMQRTVTEHAGRADTCATCHMKRREGHVDHRFAASRDEAFVRSAVDVTARRASPATIEITLTPAAVGHAFPTGDLFRRVRVSVGKETRYLARHFVSRAERPGVIVKSETDDDRMLGAPRTITVPAAAGPVRVEVVYERAEGASERTSSRARVDGAVRLFSATL